MKVAEVLKKEFIIAALTSRTKRDVLRELADVILAGHDGYQPEEAVTILQEREKLGSTGIGDGIAIPHGKRPMLDEMAVSLARLEQSKLQALQVASHELRNPLSAVKGAASLLGMRIDEGKQAFELRPLVDIIVRQANDLTDKTIRIFDALILANHWRAMDKKPVELRELTREALRPFLAAESGNRLAVCGLDPDLPDLVVIGDRDQLKTVIASLVSNGLKYSMGEGIVRVAVRPIEGAARISVCDRGIGVPDAELSSIFDGFARGSNLEGRDPGGLGLGLYVSAMIIRQHGGNIWAESDGQTGTHVHVELPLHPVVLSTRSQKKGG